jgi:hypothetical protein
LKGTITTGNWVMPTPVTSTLNWAHAGEAKALRTNSFNIQGKQPMRKKRRFM